MHACMCERERRKLKVALCVCKRGASRDWLQIRSAHRHCVLSPTPTPSSSSSSPRVAHTHTHTRPLLGSLNREYSYIREFELRPIFHEDNDGSTILNNSMHSIYGWSNTATTHNTPQKYGWELMANCISKGVFSRNNGQRGFVVLGF